MGLPGFEPGSIEPKSTSLDQASRQPRRRVREHNLAWTIKTLTQHKPHGKTAQALNANAEAEITNEQKVQPAVDSIYRGV